MDTLADLVSRAARFAVWAKDLVVLSLVTPVGAHNERESGPVREPSVEFHELSGLPMASPFFDCAGNPAGAMLPKAVLEDH